MIGLIIYYSKTGNTWLYAKALQETTGEEAFVLQEKKKISPFSLFLVSITRKGAEVLNMPDIENEKEITICSPVWASSFQPHCVYFLKNANLKGKKVNILLTCGMENEQKYLSNAKNFIEKLGAEVGAAMIKRVPLTPKPSEETLKEQINEFLKLK